MAQRHSLSFFVLLVSAPLALGAAISTSVFPNSACAGASLRSASSVGIGRVVLSSGEIEVHCGCPSDNLPDFEKCPSSSSGEAVCNSVLDLETGAFTASCGVVACSESECPTTVVNTVVVDESDCLYSGDGTVGFLTYNGESKCSCSPDAGSMDEEDEFTICPSPANGRGTCVSVDQDFLGQSLVHNEDIKCGVICDKDYFLTPGGACAKLLKRQFPGPSAAFNNRNGPSGAFASPTKVRVGPSHTPSPRHRGASATPNGGQVAVAPTPTPRQRHHATAGSSTAPEVINLGPSPVVASPVTSPRRGPSAIFSPGGNTNIGPGPSQRARRAVQLAEEIVFSQEALCVDDVRSCGSCQSNGPGVDCLSISGISSAICLRGECVVRSCLAGFSQTGEAICSPKMTI